MFTLESIETCSLLAIGRDDFLQVLQKYPELKDGFMEILLDRVENYSKLFLSRIRQKPQERYEALLRENPALVQRIPQHYLASYLGITPVSLSRIRNRIGHTLS